MGCVLRGHASLKSNLKLAYQLIQSRGLHLIPDRWCWTSLPFFLSLGPRFVFDF